MGYHVEIDKRSGFCSGVISAITCAEKALETNREVYSLGAIVHNNEELHRLESKGLKVIGLKDLSDLPANTTVLIRAHGEPPSTYEIAASCNIDLLECTCPVVLQLQKKIKQEYARIRPDNGKIIIFGKKGHAEVEGLLGQVDGDAIVVENYREAGKITLPEGPVSLFSQTTKNPDEYKKTADNIRVLMQKSGLDTGKLKIFNTICAQVNGRQEALIRFAKSKSIILFVVGKESSNGKVLFRICKEANPRTYAIENPGDISAQWFRPGDLAGICGATSTPFWLMEKVAEKVRNL